jgi:glycosyltransferase involved in cell wall biosynthesis
MRIVYVPLEPYESRYTLQLREWTHKELRRLGLEHIIIDGQSLPGSDADNLKIKTGIVLDAHQRTYFAMSQIMQLVRMARNGILTSRDFILFEDMFHPGLESLGYVFDQQFKTGARPKIGMRCLAQTIDPDDFVHYTNMSDWMHQYEKMALEIIDVIFAASDEMLPFMTAAKWDIPVIVTGLPFGKQEVQSRVAKIKDWEERSNRVVFASRFASEKQPEFFIKLAREFKEQGSSTEFAFVSGGSLSHPKLDQAVLNGYVSVYPFQKKNAYYELLNDSKVLFNCALQDWVSNTLSEADALGCNVLYPAYRSFPEALNNNIKHLYIPWSTDDASDKLDALMLRQSAIQGSFSDKQDGSIERTFNAISSFMSGEKNYDIPTDTRYRQRITRKALHRF